MDNMKYYPEGTAPSLRKRFYTVSELKAAIKSREIFEGRVVLCDSEHNLHVDLGGFRGIIPKNEGALGILEKTVRDIALISKVNRFVCFRIAALHRDEKGTLIPVLSRRSVQLSCKNEYIDKLSQGDVISARVTRLEGFGAFIDIGAGLNSLIPIDMLSVSRISHPRERLYEGELIKTVLKKREAHKLTFSMRELLGTWEENAAAFNCGDTVTGVARSIESYGVFVELTPNLAGLAETTQSIEEGERVSVLIKSISPQRLKIKLTIIEGFKEKAPPEELNYYISGGRIDSWHYSPPGAEKQIVTEF